MAGWMLYSSNLEEQPSGHLSRLAASIHDDQVVPKRLDLPPSMYFQIETGALGPRFVLFFKCSEAVVERRAHSMRDRLGLCSDAC